MARTEASFPSTIASQARQRRDVHESLTFAYVVDESTSLKNRERKKLCGRG